MKVHAQKIETLTLSSETPTSDIERFFAGQGTDIIRNTFGVKVGESVYLTGNTYSKSPDGSIREYDPYIPQSTEISHEDYIEREIDSHGSDLKLTHAVKGGYTITGFNTEYNPANIFCGMGVGSVEELNIQFQSGAIEDGHWNGITNEVLLAIVLDRLQLFQSGKYPCDQNAEAIKGIQHALDSLLDRKSPGINEVHPSRASIVREDGIHKLKEIFDGWTSRDLDRLEALALLLSENDIQIGRLTMNKTSLTFKYKRDPKGQWLTVSVDDICDPSRTKWGLSGNGYTIMVNHHPIFDHEIILKKVLK